MNESILSREVTVDGTDITGFVDKIYDNPHTGIPVVKVKITNFADLTGHIRQFIFVSPNQLSMKINT